MALPVNGSKHLILALLLIYRPSKDERLSWPSWLTCCGRFTHISGHPSAAGRVQDRESSPVRYRRSTTVLRHQLFVYRNEYDERQNVAETVGRVLDLRTNAAGGLFRRFSFTAQSARRRAGRPTTYSTCTYTLCLIATI